MDNKISICFFAPEKHVSGVPMLFLRMSNAMIAVPSVEKIFIIDYEDGFFATNVIKDAKVQVLPFEKNQPLKIPDNVILVMQSILPYRLPSNINFSGNAKLVFWTLHPDNFVPISTFLPIVGPLQLKSFKFYKLNSLLFLRGKLNALKKFVLISNEKNGLWFMDEPALRKTKKYLDINIQHPVFVPVPAKPSPYRVNKNKTFANGDAINFCWVGRLCDFKSYILMYTIKQLSDWCMINDFKISYTVIGEGPFAEQIKNLDVNHDRFELKLIGNQTEAQLDDILLNQVDILTAMGTSALEGAKFGIPTFLLDVSYHDVEEGYLFRWLHDTLNFDLGHTISKDDTQKGNQNLTKMLTQVTNAYSDLSDKSEKYFYTNHNIDVVLQEFLAKSKKSKLTYADLDESLFKKSMARIVYDILKR